MKIVLREAQHRAGWRFAVHDVFQPILLIVLVIGYFLAQMDPASKEFEGVLYVFIPFAVCMLMAPPWAYVRARKNRRLICRQLEEMIKEHEELLERPEGELKSAWVINQAERCLEHMQ